MTVVELMNRLGGEVLSARVRATIDGKIVVIGRYEGAELVFTDEGKALAALHSNQVTAENDAKASKARKIRSSPVELAQVSRAPATGLNVNIDE